jgi:acetyl-CoA carboxylase carboxyltransferase component
VFANDPTRLAGAIDAEAADKATRFMRLCDAFGIPLVSFCDTPGFMVGPEAEETALVRHVCRMLVAGAHLEVPVFTVITRKAFGLGAMAMCGGGTQAPFATIAWPSGELGAMGLEGAVNLAHKKELAAIDDAAERERSLRALVATLREQGKALHSASHVEIDDVIDPADTRAWLARALAAAGSVALAQRGKRPGIDPW